MVGELGEGVQYYTSFFAFVRLFMYQLCVGILYFSCAAITVGDGLLRALVQMRSSPSLNLILVFCVGIQPVCSSLASLSLLTASILHYSESLS
jgi:hypothetical protein